MTKAPIAPYPANRPRRLRQSPWIRDLVRETVFSPKDLIWSIVVHEGDTPEIPVASMPGVARMSVARATEAAKEAQALGIPAIAVFPFIDGEKKDARGSHAHDPDGVIPRVVRAMKAAAPDVGVMCDVALDPFTSHGHDGLIENGRIHNDATIESLVAQALVQAKAGADIQAPSDMMDGRVGAIRRALDSAGHQDVMIMAYAAKYASAFYGPYRDAIGSGRLDVGPSDKKTYQMDSGNTDEALREVALDIAEGADMVMVKPGMPYLDIIHQVKANFGVPTFAYQVSGEYAMLKFAHQAGALDYEGSLMESLLCFKRAGADAVLTYGALDAARRLKAG
jgi:porphobilinogen synthase